MGVGLGTVIARVAMRSVLLVMCLACVIDRGAAKAQSLTAEAAVTGGYSTDDLAAAAAQLRAFGETRGSWRLFGELSWAGRSRDNVESDAFGAAYPYGRRLDVIEAYGERLFRPGRAVVDLRGGRFRPPFGISSGSDHAYWGFLRPPAIRYAEFLVVSNTFLEHGIDVLAGVPRLTFEAAVGAPADVGDHRRRGGADTLVRVQGYAGRFIVGVSHMQTSPIEPAAIAPGRASFTGIDARWMSGGVQLRGEWVDGRPFDGATSTGWYADVIVHRSSMGPVTALARVERLDHEGLSEADDEHLSRETLGARVRISDGLSVTINALHQSGDPRYRPNALDVALTWSVRSR